MFACTLNTKPVKRSSVGSTSPPSAVSARPRSRRHRDEAIEKELDAEVGDRTAEEHRRNFAAQHRVAIESGARPVEQIDTVQELRVGLIVHQRAQTLVARAGDALDRSLRTVRAALEQMNVARFAIVHAAERLAAAERPVHRIGTDAEHAFEFVQEFERIAARTIELVDERKERDAALAANREELFRLRFDALGGVDQHHRRIRGEQRPIRVLAEILVARRVQQVDRVAFVRKLQHRRGNRDAALAFQRHPIAGRLALPLARRHLAGNVNRTAVQQQFFGQRGFAGVRMRDDRKGAAFTDFVLDGHNDIVVLSVARSAESKGL